MITPCTTRYRMELIYVQTKLKGQGSPELVLLERKNDNLQLLLGVHMVQNGASRQAYVMHAFQVYCWN